MFVCENNGYATTMPVAARSPAAITGRAAAFGIPAVTVDGQDPETVLRRRRAPRSTRARAGGGPDAAGVPHLPLRRPPHLRARGTARLPRRPTRWPPAGPATRCEIQGARLTAADRARGRRRGRGRCSTRRSSSPWPARARPGRRARLPVRQRPARPDRRCADAETVVPARRSTGPSRDEMAARPGGLPARRGRPGRGVATSPPGCSRRFGPDRVLDTPLSEQAFTSFATGAALAGLRPVVEFQIPSLLFLVFEQIVNQAHKFSLMTGGQCTVPVTYLVPGSGSRTGWAGQHSDHPYSLFAHVGVKTVVPATPADAYGLLVSAIRDDDPVVVFAPAGALGVRDDVDFATLAPVPLGVGPGPPRRRRRDGRRGRPPGARRARRRRGTGRTRSRSRSSTRAPCTRSTGTAWPSRCARTGRLVVIDDSNRSCGIAAEILATAAERMRAGRAAAPGDPPGRRGAAVRPGAGPGRAARPRPARRRHPTDHEGQIAHPVHALPARRRRGDR